MSFIPQLKKKNSGSPLGAVLPLRGTWQCLKTFLTITTWEQWKLLLAPPSKARDAAKYPAMHRLSI